MMMVAVLWLACVALFLDMADRSPVID